jgi:hypothetical protein
MATTPIIQWFKTKKCWGNSKTYTKEKKWRQWRIDKAKKTHNRCAFRLFHHASSTLERPESSSTFKKGDTVNTALLPEPDGPRVSPDSE